MKTRKGRSRPRPLTTKTTMHLVLRSSKAVGEQSFRRTQNRRKIERILQTFSGKFGVKILTFANVGNHLHFQIKLGNRHTYRPFIRATTAAIAMAISGASRWNKQPGKFWDYRPFTRIVESLKAHLNLRDYLFVNQLEGFGCDRSEARWIVSQGKNWNSPYG